MYHYQPTYQYKIKIELIKQSGKQEKCRNSVRSNGIINQRISFFSQINNLVKLMKLFNKEQAS